MVVNYKGHYFFAFSDTHGMYRSLNVPDDADILICAGDACEGFAPDQLKDFFTWYVSIPAKFRNFEAGILTDDPALVEAAINQFDSVWRGAKCNSCGRKKFCGDPIVK